MRKAQARIVLSNLVHNYYIIREIAPSSAVLAVVKADAYGHGVTQVVDRLEKLGNDSPEMYAVAYIDEAAELRRHGLQKSILLFEPPAKHNVEAIVAYSIIPTIFEVAHIEMLKCNYAGKKIPVHLKLDTGMNRLGVKLEDIEQLLQILKTSNTIAFDGIYTHFAESDNQDKTFTKQQLSVFNQALGFIESEGFEPRWVHSANSGAIFSHPDSHFNAVRPGISLYGYFPAENVENKFELLPVMELISEVESVKILYAGDTVSYGRTFSAPGQTRIASLAIGYADGVARALSNNMTVLIHGEPCAQRGIITMDRIMVEIGDKNIKVGDEAVLIGSGRSGRISAWDWCRITGSIPYEVTCGISKRVERKYIDEVN